MKTFRLDPAAGDQSTAVVEEVDKLLREGKRVVVTVAQRRRFEKAAAEQQEQPSAPGVDPRIGEAPT